MKLSRYIVSGIVVLTIISLAGLLLVQSFLINTARELKEQAFQRNVLAAMNSAAQKLEVSEAVDRMFFLTNPGLPARAGRRLSVMAFGVPDHPDPQSIDSIIAHQQRIEQAYRNAEENAQANAAVQLQNGYVVFTVPGQQHVQLQVFDATTGKDTVLVDTVKEPGQYRVLLPNGRNPQHNLVRYQTDSLTFVLRADSTAHRDGSVAYSYELKQNIINKVADNLFRAELEPIERRLDPAMLDSIISGAFRESGINLSYAFGVVGSDDSLRMVQPASYRHELTESPYRTRLFPSDLFASANDLVVYFPEQRTYLWQQMTPLLAATVIFTVIIALCFVYTIRTILRQRRFAEQTVEFINNMTHEFKTPISTVALASEALLRSDPGAQDERVRRYGQMIQDENQRMRSQVDKILQMAVLEEGDYELHLVDVDLHDVIRKAAASIAIHVEHRSGSVTCRLEAQQHTIKADPVHLTNIIHNLLDNANKYSPEKPTITISTRNGDNGIFVRIEDSGMGIDERDLKYVFEKYYRVPSGNIHNVKGFGIGLSYVKLMVTAHGGRIRLDSQPGKGTQVELFFPVVEQITEP